MDSLKTRSNLYPVSGLYYYNVAKRIEKILRASVDNSWRNLRGSRGLYTYDDIRPWKNFCLAAVRFQGRVPRARHTSLDM